MTHMVVTGGATSFAQRLYDESVRDGDPLLIATEDSRRPPLPIEHFISTLSGPPEQGPFDVTVAGSQPSASGLFPLHATFESGIWWASLSFADNSDIRWDFNPNVDLYPHEDGADYSTLDFGSALLEPITVGEYQAIEAALRLLWKVVDDDRLAEHYEPRLRPIVQLIADEHRETEPGTTERWGLVAVMRRGLKSFLSGEGVQREIVPWGGIADTFGNIGWKATEAQARSAEGRNAAEGPG